MSRFVCKAQVWQAISDIASLKGIKHAAIAYFGTTGSRLLPLKKGSILVVDLSQEAVRQGVTNPHEIEILMERGVRVYTQRGLHAKVIVGTNVALVGSANISVNSKQRLIESAVLLNDRHAINAAKTFVLSLCNEPVRPEYIQICKGLYKPPRFNPGIRSSTTRQKGAKLWLAGLTSGRGIPEVETARYEAVCERAEKRPRIREKSKLTDFNWYKKPKMADELEVGDWVIQIVKHPDGSIKVYPPGTLHRIDSYVRKDAQGKRRWIFHLEVPAYEGTIDWEPFRKEMTSTLGKKIGQNPRTMPIRDEGAANELLSMWRENGRPLVR